MLIASKIEEIYAPELNDFVYITDDAYSAAEVRQMELRIIRALKFNLGDPLALNFLRRYSKAGDVDVNQHALAKYIGVYYVGLHTGWHVRISGICLQPVPVTQTPGRGWTTCCVDSFSCSLYRLST